MSAEETRSLIAAMRGHAETERRLADRAQLAAARQELLAVSAVPGDARRVHADAVAARHNAEALHRLVAEMARARADRLEAWLSDPCWPARRPRMLDVVAEVLGTPSASAILWFGRDGQWSRLSASDSLAQAACEAEILTGQGPSTQAWRTGRSCATAAVDVAARWPLYAHAAPGAQAVVAAPLGPASGRLGAICAHYPAPGIGPSTVATTNAAAAAVTRLLLHQDNAGSLLARDTDLTIVYQAVGLISVRADCDLNDARSLLAARAFAAGVTLAEAAAAVLSGDFRI